MRWLSRLRAWATRDRVSSVDNPVLGVLVLNESRWEVRIPTEGGAVVLGIGGHNEPDPELIASARALAADIDSFSAAVARFLAAETERDEWSAFADEIRSLVLCDVFWPWPGRPDEGMVFFDNPTGWRFWRCWLEARQPVGLVFDG